MRYGAEGSAALTFDRQKASTLEGLINQTGYMIHSFEHLELEGQRGGLGALRLFREARLPGTQSEPLSTEPEGGAARAAAGRAGREPAAGGWTPGRRAAGEAASASGAGSA